MTVERISPMLAAVRGRPDDPVGVVLAGGLGRRIGGDKAAVSLGGRPLIDYPVEALRAVLSEVRIVAKPATVLAPIDGVEIWREPAEPRHPLVGIVHALKMARPRSVLVCAADMPFLTAAAVASLAGADAGAAPAVVAASDAGLEPLFAHYRPAALAPLQAAVNAQGPLRATVEALAPRRLEFGPDTDRVLFNVNSVADLRRAEELLAPD
jgi:molybdopterin-guanine dinucleotide biosynthesis protein A